jgi:phasin family protein
MSTEEYTSEQRTAEKVRTAARTAKAATATVVEETIVATKDQLAKATETHFKAADDAAAFGKSNVEAMLQAGSIFFHGMEELTRSLMGITQSQVETSLSTAKALISAKTLTEFTTLQNAYAKSAFDNVVTEATQLSEIAIRVANEAIEPLTARVTAAIEHASKPPLTF